MNENTRRACTPQAYIRQLFNETENGRLTIRYFPVLDQAYAVTYPMDWTAAQAEQTVKRYDALTAALTRIGEQHDACSDATYRAEQLTAEEQAVWDTYIRPFDPFEVDLDVIADLYFRREADSLEEEEDELLERHHDWFVANSRQRLSSERRCPSQLINRAQRYEALIRMHAPAAVVAEEGRWLAEELALYHHSTDHRSAE